MQGYDGGGSLQFPLESFMWDRSEAKFFKYESARITLNFLKINGHSFISGRYRSSKSYSVFTETHFLRRAQNYCRHFCALSYTKKYVQSYRLVKKPREMVRWNPKLQRHREISGCHDLLKCGSGAKRGMFRCCHDCLRKIWCHKAPHSITPNRTHPAQSKSIREIPKMTKKMFGLLSHKFLKDCQPFIRWAIFKTLKHFESSV